MANGDVVLSRKEHREILQRLGEIRNHHSHRMVKGQHVPAAFAHDDDVHEEAGFTIDDCPQCSVLTHVSKSERILQEKVNPPAADVAVLQKAPKPRRARKRAEKAASTEAEKQVPAPRRRTKPASADEEYGIGGRPA